MSRGVGWIALAVLFGLGVMAWTVPQPGPAPSERVRRAPPPAVGASAPMEVAISGEVAMAPAPLAADRIAAGAVRSECRVRCVSVDGAPLAGCRLTAGGEHAAGGAAAISDARGEARVLVPAGSAVELRVVGTGWLTVVRSVLAVPAGVDLGDVRLRPGALVEGVVTDPRQQPYGGVRVEVRCRVTSARDDGWREWWPQRAVTADDGTFAFGSPLPPGTADVQCDGAPPPVGSTEHVLRADAANQLAIVCRASAPTDWITGVVHDAAGAEVADAIVQAAAGDGPCVAAARTDADGAFRLYRGDAGAASAWLTATALAHDRCSGRIGPFPWGTRDVAIELPAGAALRLFVSDAATGAPIEQIAVQCVRTTGVRGERAPRRRPRAGGGGAMWLDDVAAGPGRLLVWPDDERWLPSAEVAFDHDGSGTVVHVVLPRAETCPVLVCTAAGRPLPGVQVELLAPAPNDVVRDLANLFDNGGARNAVNVRLARGATGTDGRALLRWFDDPRPLLLRVHGPGTSPHAEPDVHIGPSGCTVVVEDAGRLELVLHGAGGARVVLHAADGARQLPPAWAGPLALDGEGRGGADVPAGRWCVSLQRQLAVNGETSPVWLRAPAPLATVDVASGAVERVERDVTAAMAPAELTGTAFVDGEPAGTVLLLCGEADAAGGGAVRARHAVEGHTDARGAFVFSALLPGVYSLELRVRSGGAQVAVPLGEWVHVAPGERRVHAPVVVNTCAVTIRVRGGEIAGRSVELAAQPGIALLATLDAAGAAVLERVPAATYRVRLRCADGIAELGTAVVTGRSALAFVFDAR